MFKLRFNFTWEHWVRLHMIEIVALRLHQCDACANIGLYVMGLGLILQVDFRKGTLIPLHTGLESYES